MKKLLLLLALVAASCATTSNDIIYREQKLMVRKYKQAGTYYFQFIDGSVLVVDANTYHSFHEKRVVELTWRRK